MTGETENVQKNLKEFSDIPDVFLSDYKIENYKKAKKEELEKKIICDSLPYHYVIEPTNVCNLKCPLCPTGLDAGGRKKGKMELENFFATIDKIKDHAIELFFQNWGESTLLKHLPEMIKYASDKKIYTILSSNFSTVYKEGYIENLMESGLGLLHIDIDGTTQSVYEKYRRRGNLGLVLKNLKNAIDIKNKKKLTTPTIETTMLVMSHNEHQKEDFVKLSKKLKVDKYNLGKIQVNPNTSSSWLPKDNEFIYKTYQDKNRNTQCKWPWSGMVINWDGGISPCCIVDDSEIDFGNFFESSVKDIWNNDYFQSARMTFSDEKLTIKQETICNICKNETHNPTLKRASDSFALLKQK